MRRKIIGYGSALGLAMVLLTGCGKDTLPSLAYDQAQNVFGQYNGVELSRLTSPHGSAEEETTVEEPEETAPVTRNLYTNYVEFEDGGCGFIGEMASEDNCVVPDEVKNTEYPQVAPGGLTKIMTAYACSNASGADAEITFTSAMKSGIEESTSGGIMDNTVLLVSQLINAMFAVDANDAANALAYGTFDSTESCVAQMNADALACGAEHTNFVNVTGLDAEGQYTTIFDMYLMAAAALQNDDVYDQIQTQGSEGTYYSTDGSVEYAYQWFSSNQFVNGQFVVENVTTLGGLAYNTAESGYCNLYYFENADGTRFIAITMDSEGYEASYNDMQKLFENSLW